MAVKQVCRWLLLPTVAIVGQWLLCWQPERIFPYCPLLWPINSRTPALWVFVEDHIPEIVVTLVVLLEVAVLVGLINACLPRFIAKRVNQVVFFFLKPAVAVYHWTGSGELLLYVAAFVVCAQSFRYPADQLDQAQKTDYAGSCLLAGSWAYSCLLHMPRGCDVQWVIFAVTTFLAGSFAPMSLRHNNEILGFVAVLAWHVACTLLLAKIGLGCRVGSGWRNTLCCGAFASIMLLISLGSLRLMAITGVIEVDLQSLALGGVVLGHITYFATMLVLSSKWVVNSDDYTNLQCIMAMSLSVALLIGKMCDVMAFCNTSHVVLILWLMMKEVEHKFDLIAMKLLAVYILYQFIDKESAVAMFDPHGLYISSPFLNSTLAPSGAQ